MSSWPFPFLSKLGILSRSSSSQAYQAQISSLQAQVSSLQSQLNSANATIASLQAQLNASGGADSTIASLQSQVTTLQGTISQLNSQIGSLQAQVQADASALSAAESQLATCTSEITLLQSQQAKNEFTVLNATFSGGTLSVSVANNFPSSEDGVLVLDVYDSIGQSVGVLNQPFSVASSATTTVPLSISSLGLKPGPYIASLFVLTPAGGGASPLYDKFIVTT